MVVGSGSGSSSSSSNSSDSDKSVEDMGMKEKILEILDDGEDEDLVITEEKRINVRTIRKDYFFNKHQEQKEPYLILDLPPL